MDIQVKHNISSLIFFGIFAITFLAIARHKKFFCMPAPIQNLKISGGLVLTGFVFYFLLPALIASFVALCLKIFIGDEQWYNFILIVSFGLSFLCLSTYILSLGKRKLRIIWYKDIPPPRNIFKDMKQGLITWLISFPVIAFFGTLTLFILYLVFNYKGGEQTVITILRECQDTTWKSLFMIFAVMVLVPISEEFLFRGLLQNWFLKYVKSFWAIILTSLIFVFLHLNVKQGLGNIYFFVTLFITSFFMGFIYEKRRSLWSPIAFHIIFNTVSITVLLITSGISHDL